MLFFIGITSRSTDCDFLSPPVCSVTAKSRRRNGETALMRNRTYSHINDRVTANNVYLRSNEACAFLPSIRGTTSHAVSHATRRRPRGNLSPRFSRTTSRVKTNNGQATRDADAVCNFMTKKGRKMTPTATHTGEYGVATWRDFNAAFFKHRHTRAT